MEKLHTISVPHSERTYHGDEPTWFASPVTPESYNRQILHGLQWHTNITTDTNWKKFVEEWIRSRHGKEHKTLLANFHKREAKVFDTIANRTCAILARMSLQGFPLNDKDAGLVENFMQQCVAPYVPSKRENVPVVDKKPAPTVQDKIRQQVTNTLSDLDAYIDDLFDKKEVDVQDMISKIMLCEYKAPQLRHVELYLQRNLNEWRLAYSKTDEDFANAYRYVGVRTLKRIIENVQQIFDAVTQKQAQIKVQRIVKRKPKDLKKTTAKMRHLEQHEDLALKSINPVDIVGASILWVYDTEKRKLGYFEGEAKNSLFVKGTTIYGFKNSCAKTLRKPEEQLAAFRALRKNQLVHWLSSIRSKCGEMTGRINSRMILLRAD